MNIDDVPRNIPMPIIETLYPPQERRIVVRSLCPILSWGKDNGAGYSLVVEGRYLLDEQNELPPFALLLSRDVQAIREMIRIMTYVADEMERRQP